MRAESGGCTRSLTQRTVLITRSGRNREMGSLKTTGSRGGTTPVAMHCLGYTAVELHQRTPCAIPTARNPTETAVDSGRWRHPVRFVRVRTDMVPQDTPSFSDG